jgi:hypothetical protein
MIHNAEKQSQNDHPKPGGGSRLTPTGGGGERDHRIRGVDVGDVVHSEAGAVLRVVAELLRVKLAGYLPAWHSIQRDVTWWPSALRTSRTPRISPLRRYRAGR